MSRSRSSDPCHFFTAEEARSIVSAIRRAEEHSRAEIRVHLERSLGDEDAYRRGREIFEKLGMTATAERNAVLISLATHDRVFAILGDEGIHRCLPEGRWSALVHSLEQRVLQGDFAQAMVASIEEIGEELATHFPRGPRQAPVNELPDEISVEDGGEPGGDD